MPTVLACLRRSVERMWPRRVPTRFGPATRLRRPKNQRNQGPLATQQAEMCPRTANSGSAEGRPGFQHLVAEVGLGHVGLVLGFEVSRLARSCRDWYQLLEICALAS